MIYLDSNVFIYAIINTQDLGVKARFLLEKVQSGEEKAQTSALNSFARKIELSAFPQCRSISNHIGILISILIIPPVGGKIYGRKQNPSI